MIVVAATCAPWKAYEHTELDWLTNAAEMLDDEQDVRFFAALEGDPQDEAWRRLRAELAPLPHDIWTFQIDDGEQSITSGNRLIRICTGRNLATEYAIRAGASHLLFADTDIVIPGDAIPRLLEVDVPIVGGEVPSYCLPGIPAAHFPFPVEVRQFNTAGFLLVRRDVFRRLRWRWDQDAGMTDDPCYAADALDCGWPTHVRTDVIARHNPECLVPVEDRPAAQGVRV